MKNSPSCCKYTSCVFYCPSCPRKVIIKDFLFFRNLPRIEANKLFFQWEHLHYLPNKKGVGQICNPELVMEKEYTFFFAKIIYPICSYIKLHSHCCCHTLHHILLEEQDEAEVALVIIAQCSSFRWTMCSYTFSIQRSNNVLHIPHLLKRRSDMFPIIDSSRRMQVCGCQSMLYRISGLLQDLIDGWSFYSLWKWKMPEISLWLNRVILQRVFLQLK